MTESNFDENNFNEDPKFRDNFLSDVLQNLFTEIDPSQLGIIMKTFVGTFLKNEVVDQTQRSIRSGSTTTLNKDKDNSLRLDGSNKMENKDLLKSYFSYLEAYEAINVSSSAQKQKMQRTQSM